MNSYAIRIDIYNHDLILVTGTEKEDLQIVNYLNKNFNIPKEELTENINTGFSGSTFYYIQQVVICWVREPINKFFTSLLHELEHAANFILRSVGIEHTEETEEAYAYLKTFIQNAIIEKLKKKRKAKNVRKIKN